MMIPRIRGKVGVVEEPKEIAGQFMFEISLWDFAGETQIGKAFGPYGPFKTESEAQTELKLACQHIVETLEKANGGEVSGKFLDMKNGGVLRPWKEHS